MSSAPHGSADHGAASHAHDFDGEPIAVLPADEPETPAWLPALGLVLFVTAAIAWLAHGDAPATQGTDAKPTLTAAAVVAPPQPAQPAQPPPTPAARPSGSGGLGNLSPEQLAELRKRIEEMRSKRGLPAPTGAPQAPTR
ncbi:MAG: hypothetical protein U0359_21040 [Byssovorax sp.]